jgi:hypothetical protein
VYTKREFKLRFRMPRSACDKIRGALIGESVFVREDALGKKGNYTIQRITAALRMLAYGFDSDAVDECCRLSKTEALTSLKEFSQTLIEKLCAEYLREPGEDDLRRIPAINAGRGFLGW